MSLKLEVIEKRIAKAKMSKILKKALGIEHYTTNYLGNSKDDDGRKYDKWRITIKTYYGVSSFEFEMSIAHKRKAPDLPTVLKCLASEYIDKDKRSDKDKDEWISDMIDLDTISHKYYLKCEGWFYGCVKQSQDVDSLKFTEGWQDLVHKVVSDL